MIFPILLTFHLSIFSSYKIAFLIFPIAFLVSIVILNYIKETFVIHKKDDIYSSGMNVVEKSLFHS